MPGEAGYEDSGPKGFPAPDGTRMSTHFTAEALAALAGLKKSKKNPGPIHAILKQTFMSKIVTFGRELPGAFC